MISPGCVMAANYYYDDGQVLSLCLVYSYNNYESKVGKLTITITVCQWVDPGLRRVAAVSSS